jgi:outer membrane lipoprotein SlyB
MSDRKQPVNMHTKQHVAHRGGTGIGGGLVGAAIGGLLGRKVGGVFGCVVGTAAGALVGKGTAQRINHAISTIESVAIAAKSVTEAVNDSVSDVGNALKDTVEEVKPSVVGLVNAVRDTVDEVKPSVVGTAWSVAEAVKQTVNSVESAVKDTLEQVTANSVESAVKDPVEEVKPSQTSVEAVKDIEQVELFNNHNSKLDEPLVTVQPLKSSQELFFNNAVNQQAKETSQNFPDTDVEAIEYNNIQQREEEIAHQPKPEKITLQSDKIQAITAIIVGAVTITFMGISLGLSPKEKFLGTQALDFNQSISPTVETTPETIAQGWIFLGNINNVPDSTLIGKPFIKGSQYTNSSVVPSVGSIVTVTVKPGVRLRKNKPSSAKFNYKEEALAVLKPREKVKILKVEFITSNNTPLAKKVWAKVDRCDTACN